jgi:myo-inositol-1(or 4)-monophosphatase
LLASDHRTKRARDRERLIAAVREAGALALKSHGGTFKTWNKQGDSPVSEVDIAVNELLRSKLIDSSSDDGWLSEESDNDPARHDKPRVWVVDPIDGTRAYIAGLTDWVISAALVEDGRPTVAAVFAPSCAEFFVAVLGEGATCNGAPIKANPGADLAGARLGGPRRMLEWLASQRPELVATPRIRSLALRLVRVADGGLDLALTSGNSHDWDLAAADLLVHEAGGMLTSLDGKPLIYNQPSPVHGVLVAAGRGRHPALLDLARSISTGRE